MPAAPGPHGPVARPSPAASLAAFATACALAAALPAQDGPATGPRLPADAATLTDETVEDPRRAFGDARTFRAAIAGEWIDCELVMQKPLREGMFTCAELWIDCDDDGNTGLHGAELRIRAAVGSRFQPSTAPPGENGKGPLDHARVSGTVLEPDEKQEPRWIHRVLEAPPPVVDGAALRWRFPLRLVKERAGRYSPKFAIRVDVHTSCSDQPLEWLQTCGDDGLPIEVDGRDDDWSGTVVADPGDELHPSARIVDLTALRVDHDAEALFVCIGLAEAGLAGIAAGGDVDCMPSVTVLVEPQYPRYQDPLRVVLTGGRNLVHGEARGPGFRARVRDRCIELAVTRRSGQNRLRVIVQSEFACIDRFAEPLRMDWSTK